MLSAFRLIFRINYVQGNVFVCYTVFVAADSSMCPGVDSASKNEYQDIPGGKDGRCVNVTTLPPSCAECLEILEP